MLKPSPTQTQPLPNLTGLQPSLDKASPRLFPTEADALLQRLVKGRWARLSSEYDDPLGMLFGNRARQWTAGWDELNNVIYLLVWETDSWQEKPLWSLYKNGILIFQEQDGFSQSRTQWMHQLLESENLPFIGHQAFLEPLTDYCHLETHRERACQLLFSTIAARPEIFAALKEPLFQALEADLGNPEWPMLEIMKLHRLSHKNPLLNLFRQLTQGGFMQNRADYTRLDTAITLHQKDFATQGPKISDLLQPACRQAYTEMQQILTQGNWRMKLRFTLAAP